MELFVKVEFTFCKEGKMAKAKGSLVLSSVKCLHCGLTHSSQKAVKECKKRQNRNGKKKGR